MVPGQLLNPPHQGEMFPRTGRGKARVFFFLVVFLFFFLNCDEIANFHPETKIKWREVSRRGWSSSGVGREESAGAGRAC